MQSLHKNIKQKTKGFPIPNGVNQLVVPAWKLRISEEYVVRGEEGGGNSLRQVQAESFDGMYLRDLRHLPKLIWELRGSPQLVLHLLRL